MQGPIKRFGGHLTTVVIGMVLAVVVFVGSMLMAGEWFKGDATTVRAMLPTSAALGKGGKVTMAGAQVGRVVKVSRQGVGTVVEMEITDERVLPVPTDSRVTLRQRTPVGENYMEITPGRSSRALGEDDVLPIGRSDEYVDVDQILSVLDGPARDDARALIQGLGGAVDGRGVALNKTLREASEVVDAGGRLFGLLSEDRAQVASLVARLGAVSAAVGERGEAVRVTASRGLQALRAVASRDERLAETLRELPATLRQVRSTGGLLRSTSTTATPVVADLAGAVRDLRPAIGNLEPAAQAGRAAVRELGRAADPLRTTLKRLEQVSGPLSKALPDLHKTVCELAPVIRYTEPYTDDALAAVIGLGSASNSYDAVGHLIRLTPIVGENSLAGLPDEVTQAAYTLLRTGLLGKTSPLTWNPYPKPGMVGKDSAAGKKPISGPKGLAASGYKYPRVLADC